MLEFLTLKPETFGVEISDNFIRVAKIRKYKNSFRLVSWGEKKISSDIFEKGEIKEEEALASALKSAIADVKGEKIKTNYVITSLPERYAFLQVIQMPKMDPEELESAVVFEAENYIPLSPEEVYLDSKVIPPVFGNPDHLDVLIAAMPKRFVDSYVSFLNRAGLYPYALEIETDPIVRAIIKDETSSYPILIVNIKEDSTVFTIFSGNAIRFTLTSRISFSGVVKELSNKLGISPDEIELKGDSKVSLKGLKDSSFKKEISEDKKSTGAIDVALSDFLNQIKKCMAYYTTHGSHEHLKNDYKNIEKIILCGRGATLSGMPEYLSSKLKTKVEIGDPWVNILTGKIKEVPELSFNESLKYTTAIGLALRGYKKYD